MDGMGLSGRDRMGKSGAKWRVLEMMRKPDSPRLLHRTQWSMMEEKENGDAIRIEA
jgi:hypothetical protein